MGSPFGRPMMLTGRDWSSTVPMPSWPNCTLSGIRTCSTPVESVGKPKAHEYGQSISLYLIALDFGLLSQRWWATTCLCTSSNQNAADWCTESWQRKIAYWKRSCSGRPSAQEQSKMLKIRCHPEHCFWRRRLALFQPQEYSMPASSATSVCLHPHVTWLIGLCELVSTWTGFVISLQGNRCSSRQKVLAMADLSFLAPSWYCKLSNLKVGLGTWFRHDWLLAN